MVQYIDLTERGYVDAAGACAILGVSRGYLDRLVHLGKIIPTVVGSRGHGLRFYRRKEIERYRDEHPRLGKNLRRAV